MQTHKDQGAVPDVRDRATLPSTAPLADQGNAVARVARTQGWHVAVIAPIAMLVEAAALLARFRSLVPRRTNGRCFESMRTYQDALLGYAELQGTRPRTIGYALGGSLVGQASPIQVKGF